MIRDNIVYFSGPHGSGKSTLINTLMDLQPDRFVRRIKLETPKETDTYERTKIKLVRYYFQTFRENEIAQQNPNKIVLCDRSVIDFHGYVAGFIKIGWITEAQYQGLLQAYELFFPPERRPKNIVFIDPPLDFMIANIKRRWETEPKKWREDEFYYLAAVRIAFQEFIKSYDGNVLDLQAVDLDERVKQCSEWFDKIC